MNKCGLLAVEEARPKSMVTVECDYSPSVGYVALDETVGRNASTDGCRCRELLSSAVRM